MNIEWQLIRLFQTSEWLAIRANGSVATLHLPDFSSLALERFLELISKGEVTIPEVFSVELSNLTNMLVVADINSEVYIEKRHFDAIYFLVFCQCRIF